MKARQNSVRRIAIISALIIAGEAIFGLPFIVARVFRPTLLDVFGITNLQLGTAFSLYGIVAMASYFPGGPLADRFAARKLMSFALLTSAVGGVYYATIPALKELRLLFAFWGLTTILLFWAALIKATREWGGTDSQGKAFGLLDGGRGLFAAILASVTVAIFAANLPDDTGTATLVQRTDALRVVIWIFTGMAVVAGTIVWFCVPEGNWSTTKSAQHVSLRSVTTILRNRAVWLQGVIVVCAYTGYKGTDDFGLFSRDALGFDDVQAASVGTLALWVRPVAALGAGLLADRINASRAVWLCFVALIVGDLVIASGWLVPSKTWMFYVAVVSTCAMVYGMRGVYFALFDEAQVPATLTGTAAGLVSVIGYTPDIFMGPLMGYLTDTFPGALGHRYFFGTLAGFAVVGAIATSLFQLTSVKARNSQKTTR